MKEHLFYTLRQQLVFEVIFVSNVSIPYDDPTRKKKVIDFKYRNNPYKLVLNGDISLEANDQSYRVESFQDLIKGLIKSNRPNKKVA